MRFQSFERLLMPSSGRLISRSLLMLLVLRALSLAEAKVACTRNTECEELLFTGSECRNGFCSNPFEKGCLNALLKAADNEQTLSSTSNSTESEGEGIREKISAIEKRLKNMIRVCNSEDPPGAAETGICTDYSQRDNKRKGPSLYSDYNEIRIMNQNWESPMFAAWILQILLSEILQVPTSIETGEEDLKMNFYDPDNRFEYGKANEWGAVERAAEAPGADCRIVQQQDKYKSCAHVIPELWNGHFADMRILHRKGVLESPQNVGATGQQALYVPKFTGRRDPTLLNYFGLQGEENRRKLADRFKRPTTFKDYCDLVSPNNCTEPDGVAQRAPNEEELHRYYVADVYTGHFRATDENDCDLNPTNCTGHVGDYPCGWSSFLLPQMYHLNIALRSSGMEKTSNGYSYQQLSDLWAAANATNSDLMTVWWLPEALYSTYLGTEAEMTRVTLTPPTQECIENRIFASERCEATSFEDLVGDPRGACDEAPQMLHKVITSSLYSAIYDPSIPDARRSPAYDAIKAFTITELQLGEILKAWLERDVDRYGFDGRLATCQWVGNNLDYLSDFIPRSYPRLERQEDSYESAIFFPAIIIGALSTLTVITTIGLTYYWRATYVLQFAQVEFLFLLLVGLFMVAAGSVLLAIEPTDGTCTCLAWLISLGYTLELVPLIVKVGAINKLLNAAKRMRRVKLSRLQLFGTVAALSAIVISFLVLWTTLDPQQRSSEYTLTDETTEYGETVVTLNYFCSSDSQTWRYITVGWHLVLLICATVLAFQTRNIREGFNESQVLAFMIYSHFFFVVLRVITFILGNAISESYLAGLRSMIYSTDTLVTISIYFIPKFLTDDQNFVQNSRRGSLSNFPPQHSRNFSDGSYAAFSLSLNNADNSYNNDNDFTGRQDDSEDKCDDGDAGDRAIYSDVEQHQQGVMSSYLTKHSRKNSIDSIPSVPPSSLKPTSNDGDATENGSDDRNTNSNGHRVSFALQTDDDGLVDCNNSSDPTINETDDRRNNNSNVHRVSFDVPKDCDDQVDC